VVKGFTRQVRPREKTHGSTICGHGLFHRQRITSAHATQTFPDRSEERTNTHHEWVNRAWSLSSCAANAFPKPSHAGAKSLDSCVARLK
jgi:hypothetical protein